MKEPRFLICEICGKQFEAKWPYNQKTCNDSKCRAAHTRNVANNKTKICKLCGKEFIPNSPRQKYCAGPHYKACEVCGKQFLYNPTNPNTRTCGSKECKQAIRIQTNIERFGSDNVMKTEFGKERLKASNQEKYEKDWVTEVPEVKTKMQDTIHRKYGNGTVCDPAVRARFEQTMLERHGGKYSMNSPELRSRIVATMEERYGVPYYCMTEDYQNHQKWLISKTNVKFHEALLSAGVENKLEKRIKNRQYDIAIESSRILIEIDPTITHNSYMSIFNKESSGLDKNYHLEKSTLAKENGYRCIHVFDWDDWDKVIQLLTPSTTLYARNLEIREVGKVHCDEFEKLYHLQGTCKGQAVRLGLYQGEELVQIMTFGDPRYTKKYSWELLRLCTKPEYKIVGGAEKLFKYFIRTYNPESIISYCDLSKFSGDVYTRLGMILDHISPPAKNWSFKNKRITDNLLRSRGYDQIFKTSYGKGTSNEELMLQNSWLPVYDCGQAVFVWKK